MAVFAALLLSPTFEDFQPSEAEGVLGSDGGLCATCWSAPSPALLARVSDLGLTWRELQVARCASTGTSNVLIARHLGISRRTVEAHLRNIYLKAGVNNRTRLANLLVGRPT